jgi:hypothetical protein
MADDRMKNDNLDKNMGGTGQQGEGDFGKQTPGRNKQKDDLSTGQRGTGQQQSEPRHIKDDFGTSEKSGAGHGDKDF